MTMFTCPRCKQAIEVEAQQAKAPTGCPRCGAAFDFPDDSLMEPKEVVVHDGQGSSSSRPYSRLLRISLCINLCVLVLAAILGVLAFSIPAQHLYPWRLFIRTGACIGVSLGIIGILSGHVARIMTRKAPLPFPLRRYTGIGLLMCYACIPLMGVSAASIHWSISAMRASCLVNLSKSIGLTLNMYANDHPQGLYPQLSHTHKRLIFLNDTADTEPIYPKYCSDPRILICPADLKNKFLPRSRSKGFQPALDSLGVNPEEIIQHSSYYYLGYAIKNDAEMRAFAEAYKKRIAAGLPFDTDLEVAPGTGTDGGDTILRLRRQDKSTLSEEEKQEAWRHESEIAVMWDRCFFSPNQETPEFWHKPDGINVTFLDGRGAFIRYGDGRWPATEETLRILWELENL